jgi:hypothetical protein
MKESVTGYAIAKKADGEEYEIAVDVAIHPLREVYNLSEIDRKAIVRALLVLAAKYAA